MTSISLLGGWYQYTQDLLSLESVPTSPLVEGVSVSGIIPLQRWDCYLCSHPDRRFAEFLRRGIHQHFKIGFDRSCNLRSPKRNYESSVNNPGHTQQYINEEVGALCLRRIPRDNHVHWSSIGLVPKEQQPGKFRLIIDLSAPHVNDGIDSSQGG